MPAGDEALLCVEPCWALGSGSDQMDPVAAF